MGLGFRVQQCLIGACANAVNTSVGLKRLRFSSYVGTWASKYVLCRYLAHGWTFRVELPKL